MDTDHDFSLCLTRLSAADLAWIAQWRQDLGDAAAQRVALGLQTAAACRRQAERREARGRARRAFWLRACRLWRRWQACLSQPAGPWAHRLGGRLRQTLLSLRAWT